jgi:hypothetical protein
MHRASMGKYQGNGLLTGTMRNGEYYITKNFIEIGWGRPECINPSQDTNKWLAVMSMVRRLKVKGKAVPLQAWSDPECSKKIRFPDFMKTA